MPGVVDGKAPVVSMSGGKEGGRSRNDLDSRRHTQGTPSLQRSSRNRPYS